MSKSIFNKSNIVYVILFICFSPIYVNLNFENGINFDAYFRNKYDSHSLSISAILLIVFSFYKLKLLLLNKHLVILFLCITFYILLNINADLNRAIIVGLGMLIPLVSYYVFLDFFKNFEKMYMKMFFTLAFVIFIKFISDLVMIYIVDVPRINANLYINTWYYLSNKIVIYSFEDYFPFIYYLGVIFAFYNIYQKKMLKVSLLLILICIFAIQGTGSRLFTYGIYLLPFLYLAYFFTKRDLSSYFNSFLFVSICITFLFGFYNINFSTYGLDGMHIRNMHIFNYFMSFDLANVFFPYNNQYRIDNSQISLHNEIVEVFSFFSFIIFYYLYLIKKMFINVSNKYFLISYFLMFIVLIGLVIQINLSNPFFGIILGLVLSILSIKNGAK